MKRKCFDFKCVQKPTEEPA